MSRRRWAVIGNGLIRDHGTGVLRIVMTMSLVLTACAAEAKDGAPAPSAGVNLAGAEFGQLPGKIEQTYHYPSDAEFDWVKSSGFAVVRLPFVWERLQPTLSGEFDKDELAELKAAVARAEARGLTIIVDPHNYGRWRGEKVGSKGVPVLAFADFWRRLAHEFAGRASVAFGLMNEPHDMPVTQWAAAAQAGVDAIRAAGACNTVLIPGANWSGAHSWKMADDTGSNASVMAAIHDPGPHAFEFHQYLDQDWSGTHAQCRKPAEAVAALSVATDWLREHERKGYLGEFGAGASAKCLAGLDAMLKHMSDNRDVWIGWAYWAAGAWWPKDYALSIQPVDGKQRPQMKVLSKWIGPGQSLRGCDAPKQK
jgi:endoglucanase